MTTRGPDPLRLVPVTIRMEIRDRLTQQRESMRTIADDIQRRGYHTSKSAIGRWAANGCPIPDDLHLELDPPTGKDTLRIQLELPL